MKINPSVLVQSVGDEIVLLDMRSEEYLGLNTVGAEIWRHLQAGKSLDEIELQLAKAYPDMPRQQISNDLSNLIAKLCAHNLLSNDH